MSDSLQELLEKLNGVSKKTFSGREIEASNLVRDIVSTCQDFVTASEIGKPAFGRSCNFFVFNSNKASFTFLIGNSMSPKYTMTNRGGMAVVKTKCF